MTQIRHCEFHTALPRDPIKYPTNVIPAPSRDLGLPSRFRIQAKSLENSAAFLTGTCLFAWRAYAPISTFVASG